MINLQKRFVKMIAGSLSAVMLTYALVPAAAFAAGHRPLPPHHGPLPQYVRQYSYHAPHRPHYVPHRPPRQHYYHDRWTKHDTAAVAGLAAIIGLIALANKNKHREREVQFPKYSDSSGQVAPVFAMQVLKLVNVERAKVGVRPLRLNTELQNAATIRAEEIRRHFAHERPDGSSCFTLLRDQNRWLGENIAAGSDTPEGVVDQWMHSPGHRANILNSNFSELGVGHYHADNTSYGHYWVQMFRG